MEKNCRNKNKHQANFIEKHDNEHYLFYATWDSTDETGGNWYLDSNCNNHMANDRSIFKEIDKIVKVRLGNGAIVKSKGKDTIMVETKKGTRFIKDVLLVSNLKENLLSIGQMMKKGYPLHFKGDTCTMYDKNNKRQEIAKVKMEKRNRSFLIIFKYSTNIAMKIQVDDSCLWHRRFFHIKTQALKLLY